jgi:hypothetical protein
MSQNLNFLNVFPSKFQLKLTAFFSNTQKWIYSVLEPNSHFTVSEHKIFDFDKSSFVYLVQESTFRLQSICRNCYDDDIAPSKEENNYNGARK